MSCDGKRQRVADKTGQCDVCLGTRHVRGLGVCPKCAADLQVVQVVDVEAATEAAGSSKMIDVDALDSEQCDVCRGTRQVLGLGKCPKCTPAQHSHSSQPQMQADRAVAERLEEREQTNAKIRDLAQGSHSSRLQMQADQAVAELLEEKEQTEAQIRNLVQERDVAKQQALGGGSDLWHRLATIDEDVSDEVKVRAFFERRQQGNPTLRIEQCIKVENNRLRAFTQEVGNRPTLIFHGTPEKNVGNIMVEGLLMEFCSGCGGIFGAMNPKTSAGYAAKAGDTRHFMALCVYDLPLGSAEPQPGAAYHVPKDNSAAVLWLLKVCHHA